MTLQQMMMVMGDAGPALGPLEPSGTWICKEDNDFVFSRDGKNWDTISHGGGNAATYQGDLIGDDYIFLTSSAAAVRKSLNLTVPNFEGAVGGDGIGNCQWITNGASGLVAMTTTQLRTSGDGILWTDQDSSLPTDWSSIIGGQFRFSPTAGLYIACGSTFSGVGFEDNYYTSANRTSWTLRTFPIDWTANGQVEADWFVDNGSSIAIVCMFNGGAIYSTTDCINWTLRHTAGGFLTGAIWNPILGAFYVTTSGGLISSTDGITWSSVSGNDLGSFLTNGELSVDPVTGLMFSCRNANSVIFQSLDSAVSLDGVNWTQRWARSGHYLQHVPGKYGSLVSDVITISVDPINIVDSQSAPTTSRARLISRTDTTIDAQTIAGIVQIGHWPAAGEGLLSQFGREVRLDQLTGDALNFGTSALGVWTSANLQQLWGYSIASGSLSGTFTLRYRDKGTLAEDTNGGVAVLLSAESV